MVPFVSRPRSRSHMHSPSRSHVRIPIDTLDRFLRGRGIVPLWIQEAASRFQCRIHTSVFLNHWTRGTPGRAVVRIGSGHVSAAGVHMVLLDQAPRKVIDAARSGLARSSMLSLRLGLLPGLSRPSPVSRFPRTRQSHRTGRPEASREVGVGDHGASGGVAPNVSGALGSEKLHILDQKQARLRRRQSQAVTHSQPRPHDLPTPSHSLLLLTHLPLQEPTPSPAAHHCLVTCSCPARYGKEAQDWTTKLGLRKNVGMHASRVPLGRNIPKAAQEAWALSLLAALSGVSNNDTLAWTDLGYTEPQTLQRHAKTLRTMAGTDRRALPRVDENEHQKRETSDPRLWRKEANYPRHAAS